MTDRYVGKIHVQGGGSPVPVEVVANDITQAKRMIELRPEFKRWAHLPQKAR